MNPESARRDRLSCASSCRHLGFPLLDLSGEEILLFAEKHSEWISECSFASNGTHTALVTKAVPSGSADPHAAPMYNKEGARAAQAQGASIRFYLTPGGVEGFYDKVLVGGTAQHLAGSLAQVSARRLPPLNPAEIDAMGRTWCYRSWSTSGWGPAPPAATCPCTGSSSSSSQRYLLLISAGRRTSRWHIGRGPRQAGHSQAPCWPTQ